MVADGHKRKAAGIFESMEMSEPKTIGKAADALGIPTSTARQYVKDFRHTDVFSESATPPAGQTRLFTDEDLQVLWTIKYLRAQRKPTEEIADALIAGSRFYPETETPPESRQASQNDAGETETPQHDQPIEETPINALVRFQDTVNDLTTQLIEAEKRAVAAETELRIVKQMLDNESKKRWWRFWD